MAAIGLAFPALPGKDDEAEAFFSQVNLRLDELGKSRLALSGRLTRESVWLMRTPMGNFGILLLEGDDPMAANAAFAASTEPFDVWFKESVKSFTGVDFSQPVPPVQQVLDWHR